HPPVRPSDIAVGPDGIVYVVSTSSNSVYQYSPNGSLLHTFTRPGAPDSQEGDYRIAISPAGAIFITEQYGPYQVSMFQIPNLVCTFSLSVRCKHASL